MLHVEFDLNTLYLHTLNQHFTYILKTLDMPKSRLPHIISKEIIKSKLFWFNKWSTLSNNNPGLIDINNIKTWKMENIQTLLTNIYLKTKNNFILQAQNTTLHPVYKLSLTTFNNSYLSSKSNSFQISKSFKITGLLQLNYQPWCQGNWVHLCSLCNLKENENVEHFLARCPTLKEYRISLFGKPILNHEDMCEWLSGYQ